MRCLCIVVAMLTMLLSLQADPQQSTTDTTVSNAGYIELLGSGFLFSLNYERQLVKTIALRIGGFYGEEKAYWGFVQVLGQQSFARSHHLEYGGGIGVIGFELNLWGGSRSTPRLAEPHVYFPFHVGYRFQPSDGGFILRIGFTPIVGVKQLNEQWDVLPWGGLSLGYAW